VLASSPAALGSGRGAISTGQARVSIRLRVQIIGEAVRPVRKFAQASRARAHRIPSMLWPV